MIFISIVILLLIVFLEATPWFNLLIWWFKEGSSLRNLVGDEARRAIRIFILLFATVSQVKHILRLLMFSESQFVTLIHLLFKACGLVLRHKQNAISSYNHFCTSQFFKPIIKLVRDFLLFLFPLSFWAHWRQHRLKSELALEHLNELIVLLYFFLLSLLHIHLENLFLNDNLVICLGF